MKIQTKADNFIQKAKISSNNLKGDNMYLELFREINMAFAVFEVQQLNHQNEKTLKLIRVNKAFRNLFQGSGNPETKEKKPFIYRKSFRRILLKNLDLAKCQASFKLFDNAFQKHFSVKGYRVSELKIAIFIEDITQTINWKKKIVESELKLRSIFNSSQQGFILLDKNGELLFFNRVSYEKALNSTGKEMQVGNDIHEFLTIKENEVFESHYTSALKGINSHEEIRVKYKNNIAYWFDIQYTAIYLGHDIVGVFINEIDINQQKKAEADVRRALDKEKELHKLKTRFVSTVSHEFRTPITGISSNIQLLEKYGANWDAEKLKTVFGRIGSSINYLRTMLDEISIIGKEQSGFLQFTPEAFFFKDFIIQLIDEVYISSGTLSKVIYSIDSTLQEVYADKTLLRHIIVNLLSNSLKYSANSTEVFLDINLVNLRNIRIVVMDKGIGIPSQDFDKIYDLFYRAENVDHIQGTGIGMSIVKRCVDLHQGSISIESEVGIGTSVEVNIPYIIF